MLLSPHTLTYNSLYVEYSLNRRHFILLYCQKKSSANIQKSRKYIEMKPKSKFLTLLDQISEDVNPQAVGQQIAQGVSGVNTAKTNYDVQLYTALQAHPDGPDALKDPTKLQALMQKIAQAGSTTGGGTSTGSNVSVPSGVTPAV
jgi:hypothetical protein